MLTVKKEERDMICDGCCECAAQYVIKSDVILIDLCEECAMNLVDKLHKKNGRENVRRFEEVNPIHKVYDCETILPKRSDSGSAGYDFFLKEDVTLEPGESKLCFTDVKAFFPNNEVLMIYIRSSLGVKWGVNLKNSTGVIDSSYYNNLDNDGNIGIPLVNMNKKKIVISKGERVAQGIFMPFLITSNDEIAKAGRSGGFGSSGR